MDRFPDRRGRVKTCLSAATLSAPSIRKKTSRARLMTGQVSVTRHDSFCCGTWLAMAMRMISCKTFGVGKKGRGVPIGAHPQRNHIKDRHLRAFQAKALPDIEFIFGRGFFRIELALNAKDLRLRSGALCPAAPPGSCGNCCPGDRAAHSVRRPNRARGFPRESARGIGALGSARSSKVFFGVWPPEMAIRALPRAPAAARMPSTKYCAVRRVTASALAST